MKRSIAPRSAAVLMLWALARFARRWLSIICYTGPRCVPRSTLIPTHEPDLARRGQTRPIGSQQLQDTRFANWLTSRDPTHRHRLVAASHLGMITWLICGVFWASILTLPARFQDGPGWDAAQTSLPTAAQFGGSGQVGSSPGQMMAHHNNQSASASGSLIWKYATGAQNSFAFGSSPTVANGIVYFGSMDHNLYALDAATGTKRWSYTTGGYVDSSPTVANGIVYFGGGDGNTYALDATTGAVRWSYTTLVSGDSKPAVANGVVYVGAYHYLYALDATTGAVRWSYPTGSAFGSPIVANGLVYAGTGDNKLYALDATTGAVRWNYVASITTGPGFSAPLLANSIVYATLYSNSTLYALDAATGAVRWSFGHAIQSKPAFANGVVYVGGYDYSTGSTRGGLYALDATTGAKRWVFNAAGEPFGNAPAIANGVVYAGSDDQHLYALNVATGTALWSYTSGGAVNTVPAVANGVVYFGASDGSMYALVAGGGVGVPPPPGGSTPPGSPPTGSPPPGRPITPLIFVPGIGGSELISKQNGTLSFVDDQGQQQTCNAGAGITAWVTVLTATGNCLETLRFAPSGGPLFNSFQPDGKLVTLPGGYGNVEPFFTNVKGPALTEGKNFYVFTYDWRYGAQHNVDKLDQLVQKALAATGATHVDIIAHSMGTEVVRAWLLGGAHRSQAGHVVLLAPPNFGTPEGSAVLLSGTCLEAYLGTCIPPYTVAKNVMDTIPGGADQAVSPAYYTLIHGSLTPDVDVPYVDFRSLTSPSSYAGLRQVEIDAGALPSALTDAENFHASDLTWPSQVPGTVSIIAGTGQCTVSQVQVHTVYQGNGPLGLGGPFGQTPVTQYDFQASDGDNTVTRVSASFDDGRLAGRLKGHIYYMVATHSDLGDTNNALAAAWDLLGRGSSSLPNYLSTTPRPEQGCTFISLHSPMELRITDASGNHLGTLDANGLVDEQIPGGTYQRIGDMKLVALERSGSYQIAVQGTSDGQATVKVRFMTNTSTVGTEIMFEGVPTTVHAAGSFTVNTTTGAVSPLTVDVNGDGRHIVALQPRILSGESASDYTPPTIRITSPHAHATVSKSIAVTWTASDTQSGVRQSIAVIDQGTAQQQVLNAPGALQLPAGNHTVDVYAEDRAGNQATAHATFTVASNESAPLMGPTGIWGLLDGPLLIAPILLLMGGVAFTVYRRKTRRAR